MKQTTLIYPVAHCALFLSIALIADTGIGAQSTTQPAPPQASAQPVSQAGTSVQPIQPDDNEILHHLNQVINWYRHSTMGVRDVGLPSDAIYQDNAKALGAQAVQLGFQSARAESAVIMAQKGDGTNQGGSESTQKLEQLKQRTTSQIDQLQAKIEAVSAKIPKTPASKRTGLISQRDALKSELELQKSLLDAIEKMATFVENNGEAGRGLQGDINRLAQSIPEVLGQANADKTGATQNKVEAAKSTPKQSFANSGGLVGDTMTLYDYMSAVHQIDTVIKETNYTRDVADHLRTPLRDAMRATIQRSQQLANQDASNDPQQLQAQRQELEQLTQRFKLLENPLLPLSQELVILGGARTNLEQWRDSIAREAKYVLRAVLLRVVAILIALGLILVLSEVWRRVTFRYIGDPRRRRQFLVLRRVVIGFLVGLVLIFGFVSQFSSLATFAGFITAGIAVGLQAVLLSVAAYFFIIGRYGIRVGDRISVAGITGDVVDIGLVRMYVMELAGTGLDLYPTGRIVVFSNSVLFQTGTPLFKQIPGTEYAWHEVVVAIAPNGSYKLVEEKLMAVVGDVRQLITGRSRKIWRMATRSARIAGTARRKSWRANQQ